MIKILYFVQGTFGFVLLSSGDSKSWLLSILRDDSAKSQLDQQVCICGLIENIIHYMLHWYLYRTGEGEFIELLRIDPVKFWCCNPFDFEHGFC